MSETKKQPDPAKTEKLNELAQQIRDSHGQCLASFRTGVQHARKTGDLLNQAKKLVAHKKWQDWVNENCHFELRMAQNYMRIASHYTEAEAKLGPVDGLTMTQALDLIKKMLDDKDEATGAGTTEQARDGGSGTEQAQSAVSTPTGPSSASGDPNAVYRLPEGGYKRKRQELDERRAEGELTIEEDAKLARFVEQKLETIYKILRREARKELADLANHSKLDLGHLAIVVIDQIKKQLDAEKIFLPPTEQKPAEEKKDDEPKRNQAPVHRVAEHLNGHAEKAVVGG